MPVSKDVERSLGANRNARNRGRHTGAAVDATGSRADATGYGAEIPATSRHGAGSKEAVGVRMRAGMLYNENNRENVSCGSSGAIGTSASPEDAADWQERL